MDFWTVREGWAKDNRVEKMHSAVFKDSRGWGGKCYPKDVSAFICAVDQAGYSPKLLAEMVNANQRHRGEG